MKVIQKLLFDITVGILYINLFDGKQYRIAMKNAMEISHATIQEDLFLELNSYEGMEGALEFGQRYMRYLTAVDAHEPSVDDSNVVLETSVENQKELTKETYTNFDSSFVAKIEYYPQVEVMTVTLKSGNEYHYWIGREYLESFLDASSKGIYYNREIKGLIKVVSWGFVEKHDIVNCAKYYVVTKEAKYWLYVYSVYDGVDKADDINYTSIGSYCREVEALQEVLNLPF